MTISRKDGTALIFAFSATIPTYSNNFSNIDIEILPANLEELKQELLVTINHAIFFKNYADIGEGNKQIPQSEVDKLEAAIGAAQPVANKEDATAQEIADALVELYGAIKTFIWEMRERGYYFIIPEEVTENDNFDQVFAFVSTSSLGEPGEISIDFGYDFFGLKVVSVTRIDYFTLLFRVTGELKSVTGEGRIYIMLPHGGVEDTCVFVRAKEE